MRRCGTVMHPVIISLELRLSWKSEMAHRFTWCDAAACPELGVDRKWLTEPHADAIDPEPTSRTR